MTRLDLENYVRKKNVQWYPENNGIGWQHYITRLKCIWCCYKANSFTRHLTNHWLVSWVCSHYTIACVSFSLDLIKL